MTVSDERSEESNCLFTQNLLTTVAGHLMNPLD